MLVSAAFAHARGGKFLHGQFATKIWGTLAQSLADLFVGTVLVNLLPAKVPARTKPGAFGTFQEAAATLFDQLHDEYGNFRFLDTLCRQVGCLVFVD
jgi:hypothetical protein